MKLATRYRRGLWTVAALLLVFTLVGFLVAPAVVKSQLEKRLSAELGRRVTVDNVKVNPYALSLTLQNFSIKEKDGAAAFLGWRSLYVNFDALSSLWGEWVLSEIALDGLETRVAVNADQSFNFSDILAKVAAQQKSAPPAKSGRPIRIASLKVSDARVDFSDASKKQPFATKIGPLTFALTEFRTVSKVGAPYRFEAATESGERFAWSGTLQAEPLRSTGELTLENLLLPKYAPYYADQFQADILEGKLSVRGHYEMNLTEGQRALKLSAGAVQLRSFRLVERASQEPAVELPALDVTGIQADALAQKATLEAIAVNGGRVTVRRSKDGAINLLAMLKSATPAPAAAATLAPGAPPSKPASGKLPDVKIGEVGLKDFQVNLADQAAPRPVQLALNGIQFSLRNVALTDGALMPLQLAFTLGQQGTVRVDGNVGLVPLTADLKTEVTGLEILPLSPYLEQFVNARLTQGSVSAALNTQVLMTDAQQLAATVSGDVTVEKLGLVDAARNEELAGFGSLALKGLHASKGQRIDVTIDEIDVNGPYARVIMNQDHSLNLATVMPSSPNPPAAEKPSAAPAPAPTPPANSATPTPAAPSSAAADPKIEITKVVISDGDYRFTDRSVEPSVQLALNQFGGTISGLSSTNPAKASVDLKAMVDGAGPVAITGKLDPLGAVKTVDLKIDVKNMDLVPLSPYSGKFAGYELARGKLVLDVKLLVDGAKIDAANVITLNQFTFGTPVKSPDATGLPVRLGVALLKDLEGKIVIDVPVQGSMGDPNFRIGRVVLRVVTNLLTKAAVSPFSLLGSMFGGGGEELAYQDFAPGSTEINPAEVKKLQTMVKALSNRPGLNVDVDGHYDPAADAYALKRTKLNGLVRRALWESKRAQDPNLPPPDQLVVSADDEAAVIKKLFNEKFPPGTQFGAPVPPPPAPAAPPPAPPAGFFKRVINAITFQAAREERAAKDENERRATEHEKAVVAAAESGLPLDEMKSRLAESLEVGENELRSIAHARAERVRDYFVNEGKIAPERVFLAKESTDVAKGTKGARVFLGLQ